MEMATGKSVEYPKDAPLPVQDQNETGLLRPKNGLRESSVRLISFTDTEITGRTTQPDQILPLRVPEPAEVPQDQGPNGNLKHVEQITRGRRRDEISIVDTYMDEIGKIPLLTPNEELKLAFAKKAGRKAREKLERDQDISQTESDELDRQIKAGKEAETELIQSNLRLVAHVAKKYMGRGLEFLELVAEGNTGLIHAVELFEPDKGFKFSTYAYPWILQRILKSLFEQTGVLTTPIGTKEEFTKLIRFESDFQNLNGRVPTVQELAQSLGTKPERIAAIRRATLDPVSLEENLGDSDGATLGELIVDPDSPDPAAEAEKSYLASRLRSALISLNPREQTVIKLVFGLDGIELSGAETGRLLGITRQGVDHITAGALKKLYRTLSCEGLEIYL